MERFRVVFGALLLFGASTVASAQTGRVTGRVSNVRGGTIGEADVTLRALPAPGTTPMPRMPNMPGMGGAERTSKTQADGTFAFDQVAPGQYVLQVDFSGFERSSQEISVAAQPVSLEVTLEPLELPGAEPVAGAAGTASDTQQLLARIKALEQRLADLESGTVLSEPETRVKRIEVYTDKNGNQYDEPATGTVKTVTYQRERVYRRQWLSEKLEQAFADENAKKIAVGVSAASVTQFAAQTSGASMEADGHAYQLSSADLLFSGGIAQYTSFFADIVGLTGAPPDAEIPSITLFNSYTARLVQENQINLREAWVRSEFFSQRFALSAGRLDLANYFDRNRMANDETTQFISDALVNNPMLGLTTNGTGVVGVFDPKNGFAFKAGLQQSKTDATNLSESLYSLVEVDYLARPRGLSEGNYRAWFRYDNTLPGNRGAFGISADQKLTPFFGVFGRYGTEEADIDRDHFFSLGFQVQNAHVFNPLDFWGVGYSDTKLGGGEHERMVEGYYNFLLSEKLRLSFHVQHAFESPSDHPSYRFLVPGIRLQARF